MVHLLYVFWLGQRSLSCSPDWDVGCNLGAWETMDSLPLEFSSNQLFYCKSLVYLLTFIFQLQWEGGSSLSCINLLKTYPESHPLLSPPIPSFFQWYLESKEIFIKSQYEMLKLSIK
jgi:hypothetical protein